MKMGWKAVGCCAFAGVLGWYLGNVDRAAEAPVTAILPITASAVTPEPLQGAVSAPTREAADHSHIAAISASPDVDSSQISTEQWRVLARLRRLYESVKRRPPEIDRNLSTAQLRSLSSLEAATIKSIMDVASKRGDLVAERAKATDLSLWERREASDGSAMPRPDLLGDQVSVRFDGSVK
jgi:hypothetical protein